VTGCRQVSVSCGAPTLDGTRVTAYVMTAHLDTVSAQVNDDAASAALAGAGVLRPRQFTSADELPARAVTSSSAELKQTKEP
jgi:hypothetical protein